MSEIQKWDIGGNYVLIPEKILGLKERIHMSKHHFARDGSI
jgi:hypothetical protein